METGACIFKNGKQYYFGDPLRNPTLFFPTLFSKIGTLNDKIKIARLNFRLQKKLLNLFSKKRNFNDKLFEELWVFSKGY